MNRTYTVFASLLFSLLASFPTNDLRAQDSAASDSDEVSEETWLGGLGSLKDERLGWKFASATMDVSDPEWILGKMKIGGIRRARLEISRIEGDQVQVTYTRRLVDRSFSGTLVDGVLVADSSDGQAPDRLVLRKVATPGSEHLSKLAGLYQFTAGHRMVIRARTTTLGMTDLKTGSVRTLYPVSNDQFIAGPALSIPAPAESRFQFDRNKAGAVTGVTVTSVNDKVASSASRLPGPFVEEFTYKSFDGTRIAGTLYKPRSDMSSKTPCPAIVWVHGSGKVTRSNAGSWPLYFTSLGFAVLAVDKRGVGASEGQYVLPENGGADNYLHMQRRSKDVAAAVKALSLRDDILSDQVGLAGASQAGWVIPMTVDHCKSAFAIILFGGATQLSVEGEYSRIASENSSGSALPSVEELIKQLRAYQPQDPGIEDELSRIDYPCLWLYGNRDRSNPSQLCVELIERISDKHQRDFTAISFPNGNHGLMESRFGGSAEYLTLQRHVPELHQTIERWLEQRKLPRF